MKANKKSKFICLCNGVRQDAIETAIVNGADELDKIFDATTAGVGGCGGSCRPYLKQILEQYKADGTFPTITRPKRK